MVEKSQSNSATECCAYAAGDISNLKSFALKLRESLPVDYYTVFCELGRARYELDFLHEAQAAEKIHAAVTHTITGKPTVIVGYSTYFRSCITTSPCYGFYSGNATFTS